MIVRMKIASNNGRIIGLSNWALHRANGCTTLTALKQSMFDGSCNNQFSPALQPPSLLTSNQPMECHYHNGGLEHTIRFARIQLAKIASGP